MCIKRIKIGQHMRLINKNTLIRTLLIIALLLFSTKVFAQEKTQERKSDIGISGVFLTGSSADSVYANLFKVPLLGGVKLSYMYRVPTMQHTIDVQGGAGGLFSPYLPALDYTPDQDFAFSI